MRVPIPITTASKTHVGRVRSENQDCMADLERPSGHRLLVVADGMGGHLGGATASRLCVEAIQEAFQQSADEPERLLPDALEAANARVHSEAQRNVELHGMGTTAVLALFTPDRRAWIAHVGDSRAYLLRDGAIRQLTDDHSLVAALVRGGVLTREQAAAHPRRSELIRTVGSQPEVEPDVADLEVQPGDRFLLCSDGLSGMVEDEEIAEIVQREPPGEAVETLVQLANERGGTDNITVMIAAADPAVSETPPPG